MYECFAYMYLYVYHIHAQWLRRTEEGITSDAMELGVTDGC